MNGSALLGRARCAAASWPERMASRQGLVRRCAGTTVAVMPACLTADWAGS